MSYILSWWHLYEEPRKTRCSKSTWPIFRALQLTNFRGLQAFTQWQTGHDALFLPRSVAKNTLTLAKSSKVQTNRNSGAGIENTAHLKTTLDFFGWKGLESLYYFSHLPPTASNGSVKQSPWRQASDSPGLARTNFGMPSSKATSLLKVKQNMDNFQPERKCAFWNGGPSSAVTWRTMRQVN